MIQCGCGVPPQSRKAARSSETAKLAKKREDVSPQNSPADLKVEE